MLSQGRLYLRDQELLQLPPSVSNHTVPQIEAPAGLKAPRVESIDLLRGAVMVLMVLDHCRDFFGDAQLDPTNLAATTPALFFTRWVTHFCAPTFSLLAGISAALWGARQTRGRLCRHLITRGFWLIFLEQTWDNVFVYFTYPHFVFGVVLWALGWSMVALAALIYLPRVVIGAIAVALIACNNLLDGIQPAEGLCTLLWSFFHRRPDCRPFLAASRSFSATP